MSWSWLGFEVFSKAVVSAEEIDWKKKNTTTTTYKKKTSVILRLNPYLSWAGLELARVWAISDWDYL